MLFAEFYGSGFCTPMITATALAVVILRSNTLNFRFIVYLRPQIPATTPVTAFSRLPKLPRRGDQPGCFVFEGEIHGMAASLPAASFDEVTCWPRKLGTTVPVKTATRRSPSFCSSVYHLLIRLAISQRDSKMQRLMSRVIRNVTISGRRIPRIHGACMKKIVHRTF
jgi:hypothetical protein